MKKMLCCLLLCALCLGLVPAAGADSLYIIPDSDRRLLTWAELWEYQYDTLKYAFNEIYARHGYKFETGSPCYMWFTQMPWYTPNASESSTNHHETYAQCSTIENKNVALIKDVRAQMRAMGTTNPTGRGMPTPPNSRVDKPRGFSFVNLRSGQSLPVYSAPSTSAFRANKGKASCSTNGAVYALGWDGGWMLMLYEANLAGQYRVGYVQGSSIKGNLPQLPQLAWEREMRQITIATSLTDDPALTGNAMGYLPAGTWVTYLTTMYNRTSWAYVETTINGQTARGFVPENCLSPSMLEDPLG